MNVFCHCCIVLGKLLLPLPLPLPPPPPLLPPPPPKFWRVPQLLMQIQYIFSSFGDLLGPQVRFSQGPIWIFKGLGLYCGVFCDWIAFVWQRHVLQDILAVLGVFCVSNNVITCCVGCFCTKSNTVFIFCISFVLWPQLIYDPIYIIMYHSDKTLHSLDGDKTIVFYFKVTQITIN